MNSLRRLMGFLMAGVMLAAFALPASAAKTISFSVSPASLPIGQSTVTATITNTGNSNANSFEVDWTTSPYFTVNSASARGTTVYPSTPGLRGPGYSRVIFTQQLPTKSSVAISLNVTVTQTNQCAPLSLDWFAYAWTGAPGPASQSFALAPGPYTTALPSSASCTIEFLNQPKNAFSGSIITNSPFNSAGAPVSVKLLQGAGVPAPSGTTVSVSGASPACAIATATATTDASGIAQFPTLTSTLTNPVLDPPPQPCELTASATGYSPPATISATFDIVQPLGILDCGFQTDPAAGSNGAQAIGTRLENTDGGCPAEIPYVLIWRDADNGKQKLEFLKDDLGQAVAMTFQITWPNEPTPVTTIPPTPQIYGSFGAIPLSLQEFVAGSAVSIDLCLGTPTYDINGELTDLSPVGLPGDLFPDLATGLAGNQYGCVYDQRVTYPTPPAPIPPETEPTRVIQLEQLIYLEGDWTVKRN